MARRPSSVCPSVCKLLCKSLLLAGKWLDRHQTCTRWSPEEFTSSLQDVFKFKVDRRGERSCSTFGISQKKIDNSVFLYFSFPLSIRFSSASQSPNGCEIALWLTPSSHCKTVCQNDGYRPTVRSDVRLYVRSLYEAPLHSPSSSIRQLDVHVMSKSWNELLRHWRSSFSSFNYSLNSSRFIQFIFPCNVMTINMALLKFVCFDFQFLFR